VSVIQLITVTTEHSVHVPHSDQQVGKVYYLSARKVHLFGVQDEVVREQINYVLYENQGKLQKYSRFQFSLSCEVSVLDPSGIVD